ncbi:MAG: hypothetical protein PHW01_04485 [Patescibacteria group bacterium]|nr:hypothetical protein [Patescibacteria group bacterium]
MVNLDVPPELPFNNASVEENIGGGWVKVEKREDGLYIDDHKVILYLSEKQKNGRMSGRELRKELLGKPVLHPNILDVLILHRPKFIPEDWKKGKHYYVFIFFWAVIFRHSCGSLCVRCLFLRDGNWGWGCYGLDSDWSDFEPAALLES